MDKELYNESINEFTDWVSGENSLTKESDTNNLPVSGGKIRELLQNRLKEPIYLWRDTTENLYRIFSSIDSWRIWDSNRTKYASLELANFTAPSEYGVLVTFPENGTLLYTREGVHDENSYVSYSWKVVDGKMNEHDENMYVTYTIEENGLSFPTTKTPSLKTVKEDLYEYLSVGKNTVKITFKGAESGATIEKEVVINVLKLDISTDFDCTKVSLNLSTLNFSLYADRNILGPLSFKTKRYYYGSRAFNEEVQEQYENTFNIKASDINNLTPSVEYQESGSEDVIKLKAGLHSILVFGKMVLNNNNFYSNLLYYIFGVGYPAGGELMYHGVAVACNFNNKIDFIGPNEFMLEATQYELFTLDWGYISYIGGTSNTVSWYMRDVNDEDAEDVNETFITTVECLSNIPSNPLQYMPVESTSSGRSTYLVAKIAGNDIIKLPIYIKESILGINETGGADLKLKLSAYGKTNKNADATVWSYGSYETTFNDIKWNTASGWYGNSLRLSGSTSSAVINYNPFEDINAETKGATIEIEFESEYISSTEDELIRLGGISNSDPHISIYANKAQLFVQGSPIITTNYKANERVKLAFIIEPKTNVNDEIKNVIFIVNNGICERAAGWKDYESSVFISNNGNITIGGCNSGIRVYNIRCYTKAITILNAYNNFVYDSENKAAIVGRNNIYENGEINLAKCRDKLDVIIIKGSLNKILSRGTTKDGSNTSCDILRICPSDHSKDFTVIHGRIRKHGLSTLNYPLTSYKLWTWSSVDDVRPILKVGPKDVVRDLEFSKNRYQMKNNSIPANKFVLQANYADSSGTHNGGFLRLILDIWYNSQIDGEYKLRTQPQLFTSNQTISVQEGDEMNTEETNLFRGMNELGNQWKNYFGNVEFPYIIRNAPDSFPCLVFYQNEDAGDTYEHFLGQYVFMDDKKSDYTFGQRSIYKVEKSGTDNANDPFCVKSDPKTGESIWNEKNGTKIWNNDKVLRIECLSVNSTLADFRGTTADNSGRLFDNVILGSDENDTSIGWEEDFELVYPEKEEITTSKLFDPNKFITIVRPFTEWLRWITSTYQNQEQFEATAAQHLDLYKMAAYYIFVLRFGLVDSLERNAQIKTYDGKHFHYEPWDMDIALGNRNTGGIAFDPPIDRNTMMDLTTGAISGKSIIDTNHDEIPDTTVSNWLFDALETWPYWMNTIVPKVADAMYKQGLTYTNVINMLDKQYQDTWCETIYNETGNFKYVVNRLNVDTNGNILPGYDDSWLSWLQGARTTHRHWWLKTSMDYYDAKWGVGEFMEKNMYIGCEMHNVQGHINIVPTSDTYFLFERESTKFGPYETSLTNPLHFDVSSINSGAKVPFKLYGANFIREIDISDIASGLQVFSIANAYSLEVGPTITKVNIGVKVNQQDENTYTGQENNKEVQIAAGNSLNAIEELNIRGQRSSGKLGIGSISGLDFIANTKTIKKIYALGAGIKTLNSCIGTDFEVLELPDTITSITFNSTTWDHTKLSFWHTTSGGFVTRTYTDIKVDDQGNILYDGNGDPIMEEYTVDEMNPATYTKFDLNDSQIEVSIPRGLLSVRMTGTTGRNICARKFVEDWIASIIKWGTSDWNNLENGAEEYNSLDEYLTHLFNERSLSIENIYWNNSQIPGLSYEQLTWIAKFNNINYNETYITHPNIKNFSKGYVVLTDAETLTSILVSQLSTWFGEGVFVLNSNGLVIDQLREYVTISVGPNAYVENGEIYINEGDSARILATRFNLRPTLAATEFSLASPESSLSATSYEYPAGSGKIAASIVSNLIGDDILYYLKTQPNTTGLDYDVKLISGSGNVIIHVKAIEYPEEVFLSILGDKKLENSGTTTSFYKYDKGFDKFILGQLTGSFLVGILFKELNKWVNKPSNPVLEPQYVKFKIYKNGVICSKFQYGRDYTDFIKNESTGQEFVDSNDNILSFTTGYKISGDMYKYFIPLYVQGTVEKEPNIYTIKCETKIGGRELVLSQDIVLIKDEVVAPEGTPIWGIINHSYVQLFGENYSRGSFYRGVTNFITRDISILGLYNDNGTWITVGNSLSNTIYNGKSIFESLPNITGIVLDGSTFTSKIDNITNINLTNTTKLTKFSIQNCINLTDDIDLRNCNDIAEVDASGTTINVLVPEGTITNGIATGLSLTKYELGTPTSIKLINPSVLTPSGITIDNNSNITSIDLVNVPNNKTFTMFAKIMNLS